MLKPGVEHGKLTSTISYYMVQNYACPPHHESILGRVGGGRGIAPLFLNLGTRCCEWSWPDHFNPRKESQSPEPLWPFYADMVS